MALSAPSSLDLSQPHERYNPLTGTWVLCSPQRASRPWQGESEATDITVTKPTYDPDCYLCPRNSRTSAVDRSLGVLRNPDYKETYIFPNDFPAVLPVEKAAVSPASSNETGAAPPKSLFRARPVGGQCQVICFSPRHDLTLAEMDTSAIRAVVDRWCTMYSALRADPTLRYAQFFENKGSAMGCSSTHPHGQVWALDTIPSEVATELQQFTSYRSATGDPLPEESCPAGQPCLLCDYLQAECSDGSRVVCQNEGFLCVVPYWAVWPFETMVLSKAHHRSLQDLTDTDRNWLADILRRITCRYDNLFKCSFPYSMGIHQAPFTNDQRQERSHFHIHFYPPLLRSASIKKYLVGFEMLAQPQRDITPEQAASQLRGCSEIHYKQQSA
ncbi:galactose-1-phosphate uridyl transferase [Dimargaris cristalligena]|uniref:Galactose-1-phosphate uridylyltransferase n=1 Tax=Dimargaris cristalligena TaxID=215637 RepID=A0A4P9ZZM6_9FUNG|nr:galactose-1-phosphate uridyl transferase [Dimargaris cristalligena]RKP39244.1 galactose-1-phosphate uridylyltransferase [Dimargaris cristalligena]|eukprot:RKP39244.1 galactose-1-phosphate uridylyltransferase [Dimargaris cristalligena]